MVILRRFLLVLVLAVAAGPVRAAQAQAPAPLSASPSANELSPAQIRQMLAVLRDDKRRAALIAQLEILARALPPAAQPATPVAAAAPATVPHPGPAAPKPPAQAAPQAHPAAPAKLPIVHDGLAWRLLTEASEGLRAAGHQLAATVRTVNDLPTLWHWLRSQAADPAAQAQLAAAAWRLGVVILAALLAEQVVIRVLRRLRASLGRWASGVPVPPLIQDDPARAGEVPPGLAAAEAGESEHVVRQGRFTRAVGLLRRLPFSVGRLLLDLLPVVVFAVVSNLLLGTTLGELATARLATRVVIEAYVFWRAVQSVVRMLVAPTQPRLRLVAMSDRGALFVVHLTGWVVGIGAAGNAIGQIGLMVGLYPSAELAWLKLVALIDHGILVGAVLRCHGAVCRRLRAPPGAHGPIAALRNRVAEIWHLIAIFWIVAIWLVWAVEIQDGFARLVQFFLSTSAVLIVARLVGIVLLGGVDRAFRLGPDVAQRHPALEARAGVYYPAIRQAATLLVMILTAVALLQVWGVDLLGWLASSRLGRQVLSATLLILVTLILAVIAWEAANASFERHLARLSAEDHTARAARMRTLLPLIRSTVLVTIVLIVGLTVLSEIGVNIAPLLAGAGVVGIAVGFGSQKLVQDFITGLFLLLENAMQVGDWVTVAGLSGTVEALSVRTIRLRAGDGSIHIIPFSSVTTVNNTNRDFAYAAVSIGVAYKEDTDRVSEALGAIVAGLRADAAFRDMILSDFSLWGVDQLGDFSVIIKGQVQTTAGGRWPVQREINRRIKKRFEEMGIDIPYPIHTVRLTEEQPDTAPQRRPRPIAAPPPAQTDLASPPPAAMDHTA